MNLGWTSDDLRYALYSNFFEMGVPHSIFDFAVPELSTGQWDSKCPACDLLSVVKKDAESWRQDDAVMDVGSSYESIANFDMEICRVEVNIQTMSRLIGRVKATPDCRWHGWLELGYLVIEWRETLVTDMEKALKPARRELEAINSRRARIQRHEALESLDTSRTLEQFEAGMFADALDRLESVSEAHIDTNALVLG